MRRGGAWIVVGVLPVVPVAVAGLSAQVVGAAGSVTLTSDPVLADPVAPSSAVLSLSLTAPDPLPSGITGVTIQMTPITGGIVFGAPSAAACTVGPSTVISCLWTPGAAGET